MKLRSNKMGHSIGLSVAIGTSVGVAMEQIPLGVALGLAVGMIIARCGTGVPTNGLYASNPWYTIDHINDNPPASVLLGTQTSN